MDNLGILIQAILSLKDTKASKDQIVSELPMLERQLQSDKNARVKIIAELDTDKSMSAIQTQLNTLTSQIKSPTIKVNLDTSEITGNNTKPVIKPILDRSAYKEISDYINAIATQLSQTKIADFSTIFKNIKNSIGAGSPEVKNAVSELVNALKLTPNNQQAIVDSYENLIDSIRNTIDSGYVIADQNFEKNLADEIYRAATSFKEVQTQAQQTANVVSSSYKQQTQAVKNFNTVQASRTSSDKNYFSNSSEIIRNIKYFNEEENAIKSLEQTFTSLGATVTSVERKNNNGILDGFTVSVKSATGEVENFNYSWQNLNASLEGADPDWKFALNNITATDKYIQRLAESTKKSQDKIKALRTNLTSDLKSIRSAWQDVNGGKSVKSDENIERLKQQYIKVTQAIRDLRKADDTTLASMKANADAQIDKLNQMVTQYHNAEKVATQLRAKGFETVKNDTGSNIDKFVNSVNNSKVPIQALQTEINKLTSDFAQLDAIQDQAGKSAALTNILNTLDNAKTKFQSLKELFKGFGNADWISVNSEQINKINDMATKIAIYKSNLTATRDEWKSQGIYVGEIQAKVTSLARSLPNIKKPEKFNEWVQEWNDINQKANQLKTNLDSQVTTHNRIYEIQSQIAKLNPTKDSAEIARLNEKLSAEQKTLSNLQMQSNVFSNIISQEQQEQYITEQTLKARERLLSNTNAGATQYKQIITSDIEALQRLLNSNVFTKNASNPQVTQTKQDITSLITAYQNLMTKLQGNITPAGLETVRTELIQLNARFNDTTATAQRFESELKNDNGAEKLAQRVALLKAQVKAYRQANSMAEHKFGSQFDSLLSELANPNIDQTAYNRLVKQFQVLRQEINATNVAGKNLWQTFKEKLGKFTGWMSMTYAVSLFTRSIRKAITELKEVDTLLTEISKANDKLTNSQLAQMGSNSFGIASKYGKQATDYLKGVQEMSRAGYTNAEAMGELSTAAQGAGDMTADVANQFIIATDKAYKMNGSVEQLTKTLDGINYITNNNAVNMSELSEGFSIVSSTAASFGVGADELSAALGTMASTTQQSGSEVARAFRAILLNIRQVSDEEENIDAEGLTKYEKACNDLGVSLKETKDGVLQLRDPMEVLKELSIEYNKLSETDLKRTNLLNSVGGKVYHVV